MSFPSILHFARASSLALLAVCLLRHPATASAGLKYDLRVAADGGKIAFVSTLGQVITLDLYAQVTGATGNAAVEGFQEGYGSVMSSTGGNIMGSLSSSLDAPFNANSAQAGTQQTLDGDSDLDVGSNATAHNADFFFARAAAMQTTGGTAIADGTEFKIGSFSFTVQSVGDFLSSTPITINFKAASFTSVVDIEALWQQDGMAMDPKGLNGGMAPSVGTAVTISAVPEPSVTWLLGVVAAGLVARRRRR